MIDVDLSEVGRSLFKAVIAHALLGEFVPGLTWVVQDGVPAGGPATVRFAVDGDISGAIGLLELPAPVAQAVAERASFVVRGRVSLVLGPEELSQLRGMLRPETSDAEQDMLLAYAQGLDLTAAGLADLLQRAVVGTEATKADLAADLDATGTPPELQAQVLAVLDGALAEIARRFSARQRKLGGLRSELLALPPDEREAGLERVLAEEYGLLSESEADLAAFESALQRSRREAATRFGG